MDLIGIENSRIVFLTQVYRPSGQLYLPDAIAMVAERYSFLKVPTAEQPLPYTFGIGKFQNSQITDLSFYNDGLIVSSASDTDLLDSFLEDLLSWAAKEFGIVDRQTPEKYYESTLIVKSRADLAVSLRPQNDLTKDLSAASQSAGIKLIPKFSGFLFDFDQADVKAKRKPSRFTVDRRLGIPFSQNVFYSTAPFRTKDHLRLLGSLEGTAAPTK